MGPQFSRGFLRRQKRDARGLGRDGEYDSTTLSPGQPAPANRGQVLAA